MIPGVKTARPDAASQPGRSWQINCSSRGTLTRTFEHVFYGHGATKRWSFFAPELYRATPDGHGLEAGWCSAACRDKPAGDDAKANTK